MQISLVGGNELYTQEDDHLGWSWMEHGAVLYDQGDIDEQGLCGGPVNVKYIYNVYSDHWWSCKKCGLKQFLYNRNNLLSVVYMNY